MICVYPSDCTDFSNNGLGVVAPQGRVKDYAQISLQTLAE